MLSIQPLTSSLVEFMLPDDPDTPFESRRTLKPGRNWKKGELVTLNDQRWVVSSVHHEVTRNAEIGKHTWQRVWLQPFGV